MVFVFMSDFHSLQKKNGGKHLRIEYCLSGRNGLWYFHTIESNGEISIKSEGHSSKESGLSSIDAFIRRSGNVEIIELKPMINNMNKTF